MYGMPYLRFATCFPICSFSSGVKCWYGDHLDVTVVTSHVTTAYNFMEKTFTNWLQTTKFAKVFSLEIFLLYGIQSKLPELKHSFGHFSHPELKVANPRAQFYLCHMNCSWWSMLFVTQARPLLLRWGRSVHAPHPPTSYATWEWSSSID